MQSYYGKFEYEALRSDGRHIWLLINARISNELEGDTFTIDDFAPDLIVCKNAEKQMLFARTVIENANYFKNKFLFICLITIFVISLYSNVATIHV